MWRGGGPVVAVLSLYWYLVGSSVVLGGWRPPIAVLHRVGPLLAGHVGRAVVLLELAGPLSVEPLLVVPHVVLVTHGALVVLIVRAATLSRQTSVYKDTVTIQYKPLFLLSGLCHVSIVCAVAIVVLVRLLIDIGVLLATIHTVVWGLRGRPLNL